MKAHATAGEKGRRDIFTEKQCRVLDLLIEHKTSKEIARALGISPFTVDQRIALARAKLGVSSRNELAARYRAMRKTPSQSPPEISAYSDGEQLESSYESEVYGSSTAEGNENPINDPARQQGGGITASVVSDQEEKFCPTDSNLGYRVGPEVFEGRSGGLWRLGAIVATALLLVMMILGLFAIFAQLNHMLT